MQLRRSFRHGEVHRHRLTGKELVVVVDKVDLTLVRARRQTTDVNRAGIARISPTPGCVVDGNVQVPNPWKNVQSGRTEDRYDVYVLRPVLDQSRTMRQRQWNRSIDDQFGGRLLPQRDKRCWAADILCALAKPLVLSTNSSTTVINLLVNLFTTIFSFN